MPDIQMAVPLANQPVAQPFTVILTWDLPTIVVEEAQKRYAEAQKKSATTKSATNAPTTTTPTTTTTVMPFLARLSVGGLTQWYDWYHDGAGPFSHRYEGVRGTVGFTPVYMELRYKALGDDMTNPDPASYTLLSARQVNVIIV